MPETSLNCLYSFQNRPPELKPVIVVVGGETERELNKQLSVSLKHLKALNFKPSSFVAKMFGE